METDSGLTALVYVSSANGRLADEQIDGILASSRRVNQSKGVTGALLHHDGTFLQYLEGPADGLAMVWNRVTACRLHHGINVLLREPLVGRCFNQWHMGFAQAPGTLMQALAQGHWRSSAGVLLQSPEPSNALGLLLDFWQRSQGLPRGLGQARAVL